jgi:hypothetical protein
MEEPKRKGTAGKALGFTDTRRNSLEVVRMWVGNRDLHLVPLWMGKRAQEEMQKPLKVSFGRGRREKW